MGSSCSNNNSFSKRSGDAGLSRSHSVNQKLKRQQEASKKVHKLLLLGTGNSGKSTFFKQLTILHGGFTEHEFAQATKNVHQCVITQTKNLLSMMIDDLKYGFELPHSQHYCNELLQAPPNISLTMVYEHISYLWGDKQVKLGFEHRTNLGVTDSLSYFLDSLKRIGSPDYEPTTDDLLYSRNPTSGIMSKSFEIEKQIFKVFDVGGQRSERSKWIHSFDSVAGIMYVASLSCFDQTLFEDDSTNAMQESLELFGRLVCSRYFKKTLMVLFLNKSDLFAIKIKRKDIGEVFPSYYLKYEKKFDYTCGVNFIKELYSDIYKSMVPDSKMRLYVHVTCATDRSNVQKVFNDVEHNIIVSSLSENALA